MSSGALPKQHSSGSSIGHIATDVQSSESDLFELKHKCSLVCIPVKYRRSMGDARKAKSYGESLQSPPVEKTCSVLFESSKGRRYR